MTDISARHQALIDKLKQLEVISKPEVEAAFRAVERHKFLPDVALYQVYSDEAIPTKFQDNVAISSSSQPAVMAVMLEQLGLEPGHRVLEIGAGTGYNAALMAHIVGEQGQVISIDIDEDIVKNARQHLSAVGCNNVQVICGDGWFGYLEAAPYDRVILAVAAWDIAPAWYEQLIPGGQLLLPLVLRTGLQRLVAFEQVNDYLASVSVKEGGFMPLRGAFAQPEIRLQLGPQPGLWLYLDVEAQHSVDETAIYKLLSGSFKDWQVGIQVTRREMWSFVLWLAMHESGFSNLFAEGELASCRLVPYLYGIEDKFCSTFGLLKENSLCMLMAPPYEFLPPEPPSLSEPFELFVRSYGQEDRLVLNLQKQVMAWDSAGRPANEDLVIRAYPLEAEYIAPIHATTLQKQWTQLVLDWQ